MRNTKNGVGPGWHRAPANSLTNAQDDTDLLVIWVLSRMLRFPSIRARAEHLGPDLFTEGAERFIAAAIIVNDEPDRGRLPPEDWVRAARIIDSVISTTIPDTEEWANYLLTFLAELRHAELLASRLEWAAGQARQHHPLGRLRGPVEHAFDVALGHVPLDPAEGWEGVAA